MWFVNFLKNYIVKVLLTHMFLIISADLHFYIGAAWELKFTVLLVGQ